MDKISLQSSKIRLQNSVFSHYHQRALLETGGVSPIDSPQPPSDKIPPNGIPHFLGDRQADPSLFQRAIEKNQGGSVRLRTSTIG